MKKNTLFFLFISFAVFLNSCKSESLKTEGPLHPVTLNIGSSEAKLINKKILGVNCSTMHAFPSNNKAYMDLIRNLNLGLVRYPGGTWANYWDWEKGTWIDDSILKKSMPSRQYNGKRIKLIDHLNKFFNGSRNVDVFMEYANKINSSPVWIINVETGTAKMAADWLKYNMEKKYPVENWELGNEHYLKAHRKKMDLPEYLKRSKKISWEMKKVNKKIKLAINANPYRLVSKNVKENKDVEGDYWITFTSNTEWDQKVAMDKFYDAIVVHDYFTLRDTAKNFKNAKEFHRHIMSRMPVEFPKFMAYYKKVYGNDIEMWITEWNLREWFKKSSEEVKRKRFFFTPVKSLSHALYVAEYLLTAISYSDNLKLLTYHSLSSGTGWELIRANDKDGSNFTTTGNYEIFKLFGKAFQDTEKYCFPELIGCNLVSAAKKFDKKNSFPELVSCAFLYKGSVKKIIVLNKWENDRLLDINIDGKEITKNARLTIITADSLIEKFGQDKGTRKMTKWNPEFEVIKKEYSSGKIIVPKYSLSLIEF